jgi:hypothetical protein
LEDLEPTLLRNLTDHTGNNLLHCVCGHGHVDILPWLTARFAGELNEALNDENRSGNTPTLVAIKVTKYSQVFYYVKTHLYFMVTSMVRFYDRLQPKPFQN